MTDPVRSEGHPARYVDGASTQVRDARVAVRADRLDIATAAGTEAWPINTLHALPRHARGRPLVLGSSRRPMARLTDTSGAIERALGGQRLPVAHDGRPEGRSGAPLVRFALLAGVGAVVSVVVLLFVIIPAMGGWAARAMPPAWEQALGRQTADTVLDLLARNRDPGAGPIVCTGAEGQAALDRLAGQLVQAAPAHLPVEVRVLDIGIPNAVALPGGRIYLFRGLLELSGDADQVAAVLAHEYAHVLERHPTEVAVTRAGGLTLVSFLVGDVFGGVVIAGVAEALLSAGYTREAEAEADAVAIELMDAVGWKTGPGAEFFEAIADRYGDAEGAMAPFSTHPALADRAARFRAAAGEDDRRASLAPLWPAISGMCGA